MKYTMDWMRSSGVYDAIRGKSLELTQDVSEQASNIFAAKIIAMKASRLGKGEAGVYEMMDISSSVSAVSDFQADDVRKYALLLFDVGEQHRRSVEPAYCSQCVHCEPDRYVRPEWLLDSDGRHNLPTHLPSGYDWICSTGIEDAIEDAADNIVSAIEDGWRIFREDAWEKRTSLKGYNYSLEPTRSECMLHIADARMAEMIAREAHATGTGLADMLKYEIENWTHESQARYVLEAPDRPFNCLSEGSKERIAEYAQTLYDVGERHEASAYNAETVR